MSDYALQLSNFSVAIGNHSLLKALTLALPRTGITCIVGPNGTGKATLVHALCGLYEKTTNIRIEGEALYLGQPLGILGRPAMPVNTPKLHLATLLENILLAPPAVDPAEREAQRTQAAEQLAIGGYDSFGSLLDEPVRYLPTAVQRYASIVRLAQQDTALICLNEPLHGLDSSENRQLLTLIDCIGSGRAVLLTVSEESQGEIPAHWRILQMTATGMEELSGQSGAEPIARQDDEGEDPCTGPLLAATGIERPKIAAGEPLPTRIKPDSDTHYCGEFRWLSPGRLAGCLASLDHDLPDIASQLKARGVDNLLLLVESIPEAEVIDNAPIHCSIHSLPDVMYLSLEVLSALCQKIEDLIRERGSVVVCGEPASGKTAAVLAAYLIWEGMSAEEARRTLTKLEPEWVGGEEVDWQELWLLLDNFSWN